MQPREADGGDLSELALRLGPTRRAHREDPCVLLGVAAQWRARGATVEEVILEDTDPVDDDLPVDLLIVRHRDPVRGLEAHRTA